MTCSLSSIADTRRRSQEPPATRRRAGEHTVACCESRLLRKGWLDAIRLVVGMTNSRPSACSVLTLGPTGPRDSTSTNSAANGAMGIDSSFCGLTTRLSRAHQRAG